jgi:hypothetical protein
METIIETELRENPERLFVVYSDIIDNQKIDYYDASPESSYSFYETIEEAAEKYLELANETFGGEVELAPSINWYKTSNFTRPFSILGNDKIEVRVTNSSFSAYKWGDRRCYSGSIRHIDDPAGIAKLLEVTERTETGQILPLQFTGFLRGGPEEINLFSAHLFDEGEEIVFFNEFDAKLSLESIVKKHTCK